MHSGRISWPGEEGEATCLRYIAKMTQACEIRSSRIFDVDVFSPALKRQK